MQLRKLATAMLVMGLSAGLVHAEVWYTRKTRRQPQAARSTRSPKTALSSSVTVNPLCRFLITTISKKWWVILRITPTPSLKP